MPEAIVAVPRFLRDLEAPEELAEAPEELAEADVPPLRPLRRKQGRVRERSLCREDLLYESVDWAEYARKKSSNWREGENLVQRLEQAVAEDVLSDAEVFLFTDNIVFEGTYYKANSSGPALLDFVRRLHVAVMQGNLILHVIRIAGTRMNECGIDGLSRGDILEGMMAGVDPLLFTSLASGPLDRVPQLENWIQSWWGPSPLVTLGPDGWFEEGHGRRPSVGASPRRHGSGHGDAVRGNPQTPLGGAHGRGGLLDDPFVVEKFGEGC